MNKDRQSFRALRVTIFIAIGKRDSSVTLHVIGNEYFGEPRMQEP